MGIDRRGARAGAYDQLANLSAAKARTKIVELLQESRAISSASRGRSRTPVKFYEKGDRPLEIVTSRQWFVKTMEFRDGAARSARASCSGIRRTCRRASRTGSTGSTATGASAGSGSSACRSRSGIRCAPTARSTTRSRSRRRRIALPIDPSTDVPDGYRADQRDQPGGFAGDPDIMDTWATSSLTPQIAGGWLDDPDLFARVFPMDVRPQAHDIIRTWLFSTVLRSQLEFGTLPWAHAAISGWVLDPDRKKMSKSKGNVVTPMGLLEEHGSDGVRYWAASARPGTDTAFDPAQMKVGPAAGDQAAERLAASCSLQAEPARARSPSRSTAGMLTQLVAASCARRPQVARRTTTTRACCERTESFFWGFCDDYLELVKSRRYGDFGPAGARLAPTARCSWRCRRCCGCSRRICRSSPRKCGRGGGRDRCIAPRGRHRPKWWRRSAATTTARCSVFIKAQEALGRRSPDQGDGEAAGEVGHRARRAAAALAGLTPARATSRRPRTSAR